jgi:UDPglucose 6-dehydrogenase
MKIGIIGWGAVGSAVGEGFKMLGHEISKHDTKFNTSIIDVIESEILYICVPTPEGADGECDLSIVYNTIKELKKLKYSGVIALKSTSIPGTTQSIINEFNDVDICFVPEFLKERSALEDFVKNHELLAVGCVSDKAWNKVCESHAWLPKKIVRMKPTEAEILKYFSNTFNSLRVVFANVMYEISEKFDCDYDKILDAYLSRKVSTPHYLSCGPEIRGYGGMCLPKDTKAMVALCKNLNLPFNLFSAIDHDNMQFKTTVFNGMRKNEKE